MVQLEARIFTEIASELHMSDTGNLIFLPISNSNRGKDYRFFHTYFKARKREKSLQYYTDNALLSFQSKEIKEDAIPCIIREVIILGKPIISRALLRNLQSTRSYGFSRLSLRIKSSFFLFFSCATDKPSLEE